MEWPIVPSLQWPQGSSSSNLQPDVGKDNDLHTLTKCKVYILYVNSDGKESACNVGDLGSIPGLERSPGGGHGSPLQYSCLENPDGQRSLVDCSPRGHKDRETKRNTLSE